MFDAAEAFSAVAKRLLTHVERAWTVEELCGSMFLIYFH